MKKVISVLLCVFMLAGVLSAAVFAADEVDYLVLGDSIAYGSGLSNPVDAVYGNIVADTEGFNYKNFAIPGHTTKNLLNRMKNAQVAEAIAEAEIINISIGGNNFLLGNLNGLLYDGIVLADYSRFDEIAEGVYEDLGTIVATIREANADTAIIIQTIYNPQTSYVGEVYQAGADRINAMIVRFASENPGEIIVAPVADALTDSDTDFAEDRIHPSAAGNEKIAAVIVKTLADNGLGTDAELVINTPGRDARGTGMFTMAVNLYGTFFHVIAVIRNFFAGMFGGAA